MNDVNSFKLVLHADCMPVRGSIRSAIYDLNRKFYKLVPNSMLDFLSEARGKNRKEIEEIFGVENKEVIGEYISFLEENEFVCWMPEILLGNFVPLDLAYDHPAYITNAILDIDIHSLYSVSGVLKQLEDLGCKSVQIRSFSYRSLSFFKSIFSEFCESSYLSMEIITTYWPNCNETEVFAFIESFPRLKSIVFHTSPFNKIINPKGENMMGSLAYTKQRITSPSDCHNNSSAYFNVSIPLFSESQSYHPYFNRKISIDSNGYIKNCSSHETYFGNVINDEIKTVIQKIEFQELWHISKDKIQICKECEYRYMCVDSVIPHKINENEWKLSKECDYNPYIGKWKGEPEYLTIEQFQLIGNV